LTKQLSGKSTRAQNIKTRNFLSHEVLRALRLLLRKARDCTTTWKIHLAGYGCVPDRDAVRTKLNKLQPSGFHSLAGMYKRNEALHLPKDSALMWHGQEQWSTLEGSLTVSQVFI